MLFIKLCKSLGWLSTKSFEFSLVVASSSQKHGLVDYCDSRSEILHAKALSKSSGVN